MLLAQAGIDVIKPWEDVGATPLYIACIKKQVEVVKLLFAHDGVDVNRTTAEGATPLSAACYEDTLTHFEYCLQMAEQIYTQQISLVSLRC